MKQRDTQPENMFTITIPEWLQVAAVILAVAYAIPKSLRVIVVIIYYLTALLRGHWPVRTLDEDGRKSMRRAKLLDEFRTIRIDIVEWAFNRDGPRPRELSPRRRT